MKQRATHWGNPLAVALLMLASRWWGSWRLIAVTEVHNFHQTVRFWLALVDGNRQILSDGRFDAPLPLWVGGASLRLWQAMRGGESWVDFLMRQANITPSLAAMQAFRAGFWVLLALLAALIFMQLRRNFGVKIAWGAMALLMLEPVGWGYGRLAIVEPLQALLILSAVLAMVDAFRGDDGALWRVGLLSAGAVASSIPAAVMVMLAAVAVWLVRRETAASWRGLAERTLFWVALSAVGLAILSPAIWLWLPDAPALTMQSLGRAVALPRAMPSAAAALALMATLSPAGIIGLAAGFFARRSIPSPQKQLASLLLFAEILLLGWQLIFNIHTTAAIVAVIFPMMILAAIFLLRFPKTVFLGGMGLQLLMLWFARPYFLPAVNPMWGNFPVRAGWVELPDGIGMDAVAAWLAEQPDALAGRVGIAPPETLSPLYVGQVAPVDAPDAAFVVLTRTQRALGIPSLTVLRYYDALMSPEFSVAVAGETVAEIFRGPPVQMAIELPHGFDAGILPKPVGFRLASAGVNAGDSLAVDVLWLADESHAGADSILSLRGFMNLGASLSDAEDVVVPQSDIFAEASGRLQAVAPGLVVSRHTLHIPADLPAGKYTLASDGRPVGTLTVSGR